MSAQCSGRKNALTWVAFVRILLTKSLARITLQTRLPRAWVGMAAVALSAALPSFNAAAAGAQYVYDNGGRLVQVIAPDGSSAQYTYDPAGNILSIKRIASTALAETGTSVASGAVGSTLTIYGSGFSTTASSNQVWINGVLCTVVSSTANSITVIVPAGATSGPIKITVAGTTVTSTASFNVVLSAPTIASLSPQIISYGPGAPVTVNGTNFQTVSANNKVAFGRTPTSVTAASATALTVSLPSGFPSGHVSVSTPSGIVTSTQDIFVAPPGYSASSVGATSRMTVGGSPSTLALSTAGKIGMILFDGYRNQKIRLSVSSQTFQSACQNGSVALYGPSPGNTSLASVDLCGDSTFYTLPTAGTYTLVVYPASSSDTGSATVSLVAGPDTTAAIPTDGTATTMTISTPGQAADFTFSGIAGQKITLSISNNTLSQVFDLSIVGPPANLVLASFPGTSASYFGPFTLPVTGTYTIKIAAERGGTGSLVLHLNAFLDVSGTFSGTGAASTYAITAPGQGLVFTYSGTVGQRISLLVSNSTLSGATNWYDVTVLNPDATMLGTYAGSGGGFAGPYTLPRTGTYKVEVIPRQGATGNLTVQFFNIPADLSGSFSGTDAAANYSIATPGQGITYTYSGTVGQKVGLLLTNSTLSGFTNWYDINILNPDGTTLGTSAGCCSGSFAGPYTLPQTGAYKVQVVPRQGGIGSVTLQFTRIVDVTGSFSGSDAAASFSIGTPGQEIAYTYSGTVGQKIGLLLTNSTLSGFTNWYDINILNPDGTTLGTSAGCCSGSYAGPYTLPQTGIYKVQVVPRQGGIGSVTLQFTRIVDVTGSFSGSDAAATFSIGTPGQEVAYTYSGTAGQKIGVLVSSSSLSGLTNWYDINVINPDGTTLGSAAGCCGTYAGPYVLPQTGVYKVQVVPRQGGIGSITVRFSKFSDVTGTFSGTDAAATFSIATPGQSVSYSYSGVAGQKVGVLVSSSSLSGLTNWYNINVINPDGTTLGSASGCCGTFAGPYTLQQTGTYTVQVAPQQGGVGSVTIQFSRIADLTGTFSGSSAAATFSINTPGQAVSYTYNGTAGQRISTLVTNSTLSGLTNWFDIVVLNPDGSTLGSVSGVGGNFAGTYTLTQTGAYKVRVAPQQGGIGNVTVQFNNVPADLTGTLSGTGTPTTATIVTPGQGTAYTYVGTVGQTAELVLSSSTLSGLTNWYDVTVLNPNGSTLKSYSGVNGNDSGQFTLPQAGSYTFRIVPQRGGIGSIAVALTVH